MFWPFCDVFWSMFYHFGPNIGMDGHVEDVVLPSWALKSLVDVRESNEGGQEAVHNLRCCKTQATASRCGLLGASLEWPSGAHSWITSATHFELLHMPNNTSRSSLGLPSIVSKTDQDP